MLQHQKHWPLLEGVLTRESLWLVVIMSVKVPKQVMFHVMLRDFAMRGNRWRRNSALYLLHYVTLSRVYFHVQRRCKNKINTSDLSRAKCLGKFDVVGIISKIWWFQFVFQVFNVCRNFTLYKQKRFFSTSGRYMYDAH